MFSPFTKSLEVVATWVSQLFEIGSIDLGVSIKCSEVLVNDCCVQINNEAAGKGFGESVFVLVEQVHVIFESDLFSLTENPGSTTLATTRRFSSLEEKRRTTQ